MKNDRNRKRRKVNRREFLGQASCAAVGTTALFNTVLNLGMFNTLAGTATGDYKGLVCLFLSGGIDSFNVLVPRGPAEHAEYAAARGDLALPIDELLPIQPATPDGREYGLHPGMVELQSLFQQGRLALVSNVGTLVEPTTLEQYRNGSVALPLGLFSHSDQAMHWQTSIPDQRNASGWAGRMADILQEGNGNQNISMNISLSGSNVFQSGQMTAHYTITENGSRGLRDYGGPSPEAQIRTEAIDGLLGLHYQHLFEKTFAQRMRSAIDAHIEFSAAIDGVPPLQTQFSDTRLSRQLRMIALTIAAREALGMRRQVFFVETGGWDHHDEVIGDQATMLPVVSRALFEFQTWGGNHLVLGGSVAGGDVYGTYPSLYAGSMLDTGRGRLIPTTSVDELFGELALWFGVPAADLDIVLPNLGRFYAVGSANPPLGFLPGATAPALRTGRQTPERGLARRAGGRSRT
jgi:uncharacterized protein (DUF1501 family)